MGRSHHCLLPSVASSRINAHTDSVLSVAEDAPRRPPLRHHPVIAYGATPLTAATLAERLEVTVRTIYRDIAALQASRVSIEGAPGLGYVLRRGFDLPPLMFTREEADAIAIGVRLLRRLRDPKLQDATESVLAKLAAIVPAGFTRSSSRRRSTYRMATRRRSASIRPNCAGDPRGAQGRHRLCRREQSPHTPDHLPGCDGLLRRCEPDRRVVRAQEDFRNFVSTASSTPISSTSGSRQRADDCWPLVGPAETPTGPGYRRAAINREVSGCRSSVRGGSQRAGH